MSIKATITSGPSPCGCKNSAVLRKKATQYQVRVSHHYHVAVVHFWCFVSNVFYRLGLVNAYIDARTKVWAHSEWLLDEEQTKLDRWRSGFTG